MRGLHARGGWRRKDWKLSFWEDGLPKADTDIVLADIVAVSVSFPHP